MLIVFMLVFCVYLRLLWVGKLQVTVVTVCGSGGLVFWVVLHGFVCCFLIWFRVVVSYFDWLWFWRFCGEFGVGLFGYLAS